MMIDTRTGVLLYMDSETSPRKSSLFIIPFLDFSLSLVQLTQNEFSSKERGTEFPSSTHPQKPLISHFSFSQKKTKNKSTHYQKTMITSHQYQFRWPTKNANQYSQDTRISIQQTKKKKTDRKRDKKKKTQTRSQKANKKGMEKKKKIKKPNRTTKFRNANFTTSKSNDPQLPKLKNFLKKKKKGI